MIDVEKKCSVQSAALSVGRVSSSIVNQSASFSPDCRNMHFHGERHNILGPIRNISKKENSIG